MNEKQNTFRALTDKQPLITSFLCYLGIHSWTKWSQPTRKEEWSSTYIQTRFCRHCNLHNTRNTS